MSSPTVFVCGTTGTQGGALARFLIAKGATVHSLTRDASSDRAKEIAALGVKLWHGDFDNEEALKSAIEGTSSIFLNFFPSFTDVGANLRQAKLIMSIALAAGAKQAVYTSGLGAYKPECMDGWDPESLVAGFLGSKTDIEDAVRTAGFKHWTILRPGAFMTNFLEPYISQYGEFPRTGILETAYREDTILPLVSPKTIGAYSGAAILDPPAFHAKEIDYADELITPEELVRKLSAASGKELKTRYQSDEVVERTRKANPFVGGQVLTREIYKLIDMEQVRQQGIPLSTFDQFLDENKDAAVETFSQVP
ncbi:hypothetical protein ACJ41O_015300 [Fusarium nematophilum]